MKTDGRLFWLRATWFLDQLRQVARSNDPQGHGHAPRGHGHAPRGRGRGRGRSRGPRRLRVTAAHLAAHFEYSLPSARRTIDALRNDFGAPIEYDRQRNTWHFTGPYWDLPRIPLSPDEITALALARSLVSKVTAPGLSEAMDSFWSKFSLDLAQQSPAGAGFTHAVSARAPVWTRVDPDVMEAVLRALALDRQLHIHYASPWTDQVTERIVEPRHLLLYEGSFYLAAHCLLRQGAVRLFHLSSVTATTVQPEPNSTPDPAFQLDQVIDAYGLLIGSDLQDVTLRITPPAATRARMEVWHSAQQDIIDSKGVLTRTFPVRGFAEVQRRILSYGSACEVLAPPELADRIRTEVAAMSRLLNKAPSERAPEQKLNT
jgi:predicted DNA-binding transcriptional regulator YafY